jgi:hypothetical protein
MSTLSKVTYESMDQLLEVLNRNFATIENSPLYKGIPGSNGADGVGLRGTRGSVFIFVNFSNFVLDTTFKGEVTSSNQVNVSFINNKLSIFIEKQKLLLALGVDELVDNDVIVLTNSAMCSFDLGTNSISATGLSFNEQTNTLANLDSKIESRVKFYVDNNVTITSLINIYEQYASIAKRTPDLGSSGITTNVLQSDTYCPKYVGFVGSDPSNRDVITGHKYFGLSDTLFPVSGMGTVITGSVKAYISLLIKTVDPLNSGSLNNSYAPGEGNIPSQVLMQDTYGNGIMIGHKSGMMNDVNVGLRNFASIYKDGNGFLVLKSHQGKLDSEYSRLLLGYDRMVYSKLFQVYELDVNKVHMASMVSKLAWFNASGYIDPTRNSAVSTIDLSNGFNPVVRFSVPSTTTNDDNLTTEKQLKVLMDRSNMMVRDTLVTRANETTGVGDDQYQVGNDKHAIILQGVKPTREVPGVTTNQSGYLSDGIILYKGTSYKHALSQTGSIFNYMGSQGVNYYFSMVTVSDEQLATNFYGPTTRELYPVFITSSPSNDEFSLPFTLWDLPVYSNPGTPHYIQTNITLYDPPSPGFPPVECKLTCRVGSGFLNINGFISPSYSVWGSGVNTNAYGDLLISSIVDHGAGYNRGNSVSQERIIHGSPVNDMLSSPVANQPRALFYLEGISIVPTGTSDRLLFYIDVNMNIRWAQNYSIGSNLMIFFDKTFMV